MYPTKEELDRAIDLHIKFATIRLKEESNRLIGLGAFREDTKPNHIIAAALLNISELFCKPDDTELNKVLTY
jgi:hypothetical protein